MFSSSGTVIALSTADCKFSFQQLIAIKLSLSEIKTDDGQRRRQDISKRYPISISVEKVYLANFLFLLGQAHYLGKLALWGGQYQFRSGSLCIHVTQNRTLRRVGGGKWQLHQKQIKRLMFCRQGN